jgi:phage N-6-adenine-methyltransferase
VIPSASKQSQSDEWYTPRWVLDGVRRVLGQIDLDPASNPGTPNVEAASHFTREEDGLALPWRGRVFLNPPWSQTARWMVKLIEEVDAGRVIEAIALVRALGLETRWYQRYLTDARVAVCFLRGRVNYIAGAGQPNCSPTQGSALLYVGPHRDRFADVFGGLGATLCELNPDYVRLAQDRLADAPARVKVEGRTNG